MVGGTRESTSGHRPFSFKSRRTRLALTGWPSTSRRGISRTWTPVPGQQGGHGGVILGRHRVQGLLPHKAGADVQGRGDALGEHGAVQAHCMAVASSSCLRK